MVYGGPESFANDMRKIINDAEMRYARTSRRQLPLGLCDPAGRSILMPTAHGPCVRQRHPIRGGRGQGEDLGA